MRSRIGISLILIALLAACGGGGGAGSTTSAAPATSVTTSTTAVATTTTSDEATTSTSAATTTTGQEIDVYFEGGQVVGPEVISVPVGEEVSVWVLSDTEDEVHVHGYDESFLVKPGSPVEISFTADVPGIFEVELESTHTLLFELEVAN
jgi:hypothetical protein